MNPEPEESSNREQEGKSRDSGHRLGEILRILGKYCRLSRPSPEDVRKMLEELGPTFVKVGQMLSARPDILPPAYCRELEKLRVENEPMPMSQVRRVLEEEFGTPLEEMFTSFEETPIGSASIAQVHRAVLRPESEGSPGIPVAVKVQRPGIREEMSSDIGLLRRAARLVRPIPIGRVMDLEMVLDEIWAVTQEEMDFGIEGQNARRFEENCRNIAWAGCPKVIPACSTGRVLVMEQIEGIPILDIQRLDAEGYDRREIGEKLADHYIRQVLDDGFFQADPHAGNLVIRDGKIIWLDFGMMGHLSASDRKLMRDAVHAIAVQDVKALVDAVLTLGVVKGEIDYPRLCRDMEAFLNRYASQELGSLNLAEAFADLIDLALSHDIALPKGVSLLGRGIITLEGVLTQLSPDISLITILANRLAEEKRRGEGWEEMVRSLTGTLNQVLRAPGQLMGLLEGMQEGRLQTGIEVFESGSRGRAADRRTRALCLAVLAAGLLIAAGLFSQLQTVTLAGLPWPSLVLVLLGLVAGCAAVISLRSGKRK